MQVLGFAGFALMLWGIDRLLGGEAYRARYALGFALDQPLDAALALGSLRYVPDYFDILPLYIVLLAATPAMLVLAGRSPHLALGVSAALWLAVQFWPLNLPAHPVGTKLWYFDPFAWQFLFFLGFGATAGWFSPPAATPGRIWAAAAFILGCVPITFWGAHQAWPVLADIYFALYRTRRSQRFRS